MYFIAQDSCPNCGSQYFHKLHTIPSSQDHYLTENFPADSHFDKTWYFCNSCTGAFSSHILSDAGIQALYSSSVTSMTTSSVSDRFNQIISLPDSQSEAHIKTLWFFNKTSISTPFINFLDYGCGMGVFLSKVKMLLSSFYPSAQFSLFGLDPSSDYIVNCQSVIPEGTFFNTTCLKSTSLDDTRFSIISLITVLEHLPNPFDILSQLIPLLSEDGELWIEIPSFRNIGHLSNCHDSLLIIHLFLHSIESLSHLLDLVGFDILAIEESLNVRDKYMIRAIAKPKSH